MRACVCVGMDCKEALSYSFQVGEYLIFICFAEKYISVGIARCRLIRPKLWFCEWKIEMENRKNFFLKNSLQL